MKALAAATPWHWPARYIVAVIAMAGSALGVAACGSNPASSGSGTSRGAGGSGSAHSATAFSACMRSHGVSKFPDPVTADGRFSKITLSSLGVDGNQFNAAERACLHLLPTTGETSGGSATVERCVVGSICLPAVTQWLQSVELKYAQCMRSHGVPNWPDPTTNAQGNVYFAVPLAWAQSPPEPAHGICARQSGSPVG